MNFFARSAMGVPGLKECPIPSLRRIQVLALILLGSFAIGSRAAAPALNDVRSYLYLMFSQTNSPVIYESIRAAPHDLIILGTQANDPPLDRSQADPGGNKIILGYANLTLCATWQNPGLFIAGTPPAWFGNQDPDWPGSYSVQFWNPAWLPELAARIEKLIADGYDGVFLDTAGGDSAWMPGNSHGNPVFPNASHDLSTLLLNLRAYVQSKGLAKPFYMMPNGPLGVAQNYPAALSAVDAIFVENVYFNSTGANGLTSVENSPAAISFLESVVARVYGSAGIPVFGNDYPQPTTDRALGLRTFLLQSKLDWVPAVVDPLAMVRTVADGPHMLRATAGNPLVTGTPGVVNYLSGGSANPALMIAGNQGDYFIGGRGANTIAGGIGNDTIYPHPQKAVLQQTAKLALGSIVVGSHPVPKVSVLLNGSVAVPPTAITAAHPNTQELSFTVPRGTTVSSVVLQVSDANFVDRRTTRTCRSRSSPTGARRSTCQRPSSPMATAARRERIRKMARSRFQPLPFPPPRPGRKGTQAPSMAGRA
jgi:hypothetical protein